MRLSIYVTAILMALFVSVQSARNSNIIPIDEYIEHILDRKQEARDAIRTISFDAVQYRRNMDGDWKMKSEELWRKRVFLKSRTQRHEQVFSVTEDGKAWDDQKILDEIEKLNESYKKDSERRNFKGPLDTLCISDYEFTFAGNENRNGNVLDRIDFSSKVRDDKHINGHMLIDPDDYSLMYIGFELADNPMGVKKIHIAYDFDRLENGYTYPVKTLFRGHFGMLFINARREVIEEYSNFMINPVLPDSLFEIPYSYQPEN